MICKKVYYLNSASQVIEYVLVLYDNSILTVKYSRIYNRFPCHRYELHKFILSQEAIPEWVDENW